MKYIKLFENIDWDWIDEDYEENVPIYKIGDKVKMHNFYAYYPKHPLKKNNGFFKKYEGNDIEQYHIIIDIKKSDEVDLDYGKGVSEIYNGYLYKISQKWPWYKIEN